MKDTQLKMMISPEFNQFIEGIWRTSKYRDRGIKNKSEFIRYAILKLVEDDHKDILNDFKDLEEIKEYKTPKSNHRINERLDKIQEYFKNRKK
mgnify:CR=1 FL=1